MLLMKCFITGLLILNFAQGYVLLTANIDDVKKIARKFVSEPMANQIAQFIAKASGQTITLPKGVSEENAINSDDYTGSDSEFGEKNMYDANLKNKYNAPPIQRYKKQTRATTPEDVKTQFVKDPFQGDFDNIEDGQTEAEGPEPAYKTKKVIKVKKTIKSKAVYKEPRTEAKTYKVKEERVETPNRPVRPQRWKKKPVQVKKTTQADYVDGDYEEEQNDERADPEELEEYKYVENEVTVPQHVSQKPKLRQNKAQPLEPRMKKRQPSQKHTTKEDEYVDDTNYQGVSKKRKLSTKMSTNDDDYDQDTGGHNQGYAKNKRKPIHKQTTKENDYNQDDDANDQGDQNTKRKPLRKLTTKSVQRYPGNADIVVSLAPDKNNKRKPFNKLSKKMKVLDQGDDDDNQADENKNRKPLRKLTTKSDDYDQNSGSNHQVNENKKRKPLQKLTTKEDYYDQDDRATDNPNENENNQENQDEDVNNKNIAFNKGPMRNNKIKQENNKGAVINKVKNFNQPTQDEEQQGNTENQYYEVEDDNNVLETDLNKMKGNNNNIQSVRMKPNNNAEQENKGSQINRLNQGLRNVQSPVQGGRFKQVNRTNANQHSNLKDQRTNEIPIRGPNQSPLRSPSQGPIRGSNQGPIRGSNQGQNHQGQIRSPNEGQNHQGQIRSPNEGQKHQGQLRSPNQGQNYQGQMRSPNQGPDPLHSRNQGQIRSPNQEPIRGSNNVQNQGGQNMNQGHYQPNMNVEGSHNQNQIGRVDNNRNKPQPPIQRFKASTVRDRAGSSEWMPGARSVMPYRKPVSRGRLALKAVTTSAPQTEETTTIIQEQEETVNNKDETNNIENNDIVDQRQNSVEDATDPAEPNNLQAKYEEEINPNTVVVKENTEQNNQDNKENVIEQEIEVELPDDIADEGEGNNEVDNNAVNENPYLQETEDAVTEAIESIENAVENINARAEESITKKADEFDQYDIPRHNQSPTASTSTPFEPAEVFYEIQRSKAEENRLQPNRLLPVVDKPHISYPNLPKYEETKPEATTAKIENATVSIAADNDKKPGGDGKKTQMILQLDR